MIRRPQPRRNRILRWWDREFLFAERLTALVVAGFLTWALAFPIPREFTLELLNGSRAAVYGALAAIFGSLLGFAITAVAIVLSFADSSRMAAVRKSSHYSTLWNIFKSCIRWLAAATAVALVALVLDRDRSPHLTLTVLVFYTSAVGIALITTRPVDEQTD